MISFQNKDEETLSSNHSIFCLENDSRYDEDQLSMLIFPEKHFNDEMSFDLTETLGSIAESNESMLNENLFTSTKEPFKFGSDIKIFNDFNDSISVKSSTQNFKQETNPTENTSTSKFLTQFDTQNSNKFKKNSKVIEQNNFLSEKNDSQNFCYKKYVNEELNKIGRINI